VIRYHIHGNGETQNVGGHDENQNQDLGHGHDLFANSTSNQLAAVCERDNLRESFLELSNDKAGVACNDAEKED
jgi:hypothetical protein